MFYGFFTLLVAFLSFLSHNASKEPKLFSCTQLSVCHLVTKVSNVVRNTCFRNQKRKPWPKILINILFLLLALSHDIESNPGPPGPAPPCPDRCLSGGGLGGFPLWHLSSTSDLVMSRYLLRHVRGLVPCCVPEHY